MPQLKVMMRRVPSAIKRIEDISDELRVSVVGTVVKTSENQFILDDGTGHLTVMCEPSLTVKELDMVRVIGKIYGDTLEAEIIQDMKDLNMQLYVKMYELRKKISEK
jgi:uncharacterized protein YdeI (BOF family)